MYKLENSGKNFLDRIAVFRPTPFTIVIFFKWQELIGIKIQHRGWKEIILQAQYYYEPVMLKFHQPIELFWIWKISFIFVQKDVLSAAPRDGQWVKGIQNDEKNGLWKFNPLAIIMFKKLYHVALFL